MYLFFLLISLLQPCFLLLISTTIISLTFPLNQGLASYLISWFSGFSFFLFFVRFGRLWHLGFSGLLFVVRVLLYIFLWEIWDRRSKRISKERKDMAGGGGPAPPPKQEELQPHPVKDQLPNIAYCITSPPPWRQSLFYFFLFFVYYGILHFYIYLVAHCYACYHPIWCFCLHFPCFPCYHLLNFPIPVYKSHVFWFPCCFIWSLLFFFIWIIFGCFMTGSIVLSAKSVNLYILSIGVSSFLLLVLAFVVVFMNLIESI